MRRVATKNKLSMLGGKMFRFVNVIIVMGCLGLAACGGGGGGGGGPETGSSSSSGSVLLPVADAGDDQSIEGGRVIFLDASASTDANGLPLTYQWAKISGGDVTFVDSSGRVTADSDTKVVAVYIPASLASGQVEFSLLVSNGTETSLMDTVVVNVQACVDGVGDVFVECVDPTWKGLSALDDSDLKDYLDGAADRHINWSEINIGGAHNRVIDVEFVSSDALGTLKIFTADRLYDIVPTSAQVLDMSIYAGGRIKFDVRVLDMGIIPSLLVVSLESVGAASLGVQVATPVVNTWQSVDLAVDDFVAQGVDLAQIAAIQFNPPWFLSYQEGVHYQLDNIRWEKAACDNGIGDVFLDCIDPTWSNFGSWDTVVNALYDDGVNNHVKWKKIFSGEPGRNDVMDVTFSDSGAWGSFYAITPNFNGIDMSAFNNGYVAFDMKVIAAGDPGAKFIFSINCGDENYGAGPAGCQGADIELDKSIVGVWQEVRIPVADIIASGVDLTDVGTGFHFSTTWGVSQAGIHVQFDNIRWEM